MAKRKATKNDSKGAMDFNQFIQGMQKNESIVDLGKNEEIFYKTGDYNLDRALGGGIIAGSIVAFQGPSGSGKSLSCLNVCKQIVDSGKRVAYFDTEGKISSKAIARVGLDNNENFMHLSVNNLQDMIANILEFAESGFFGGIVVDSTDSLVADALEERSVHDESKVGGYSAKIWSERLPQIVGAIQRSGGNGDDDTPTTLMLVRQVRDKMDAYGNPETTSGGRALEFYCTTVMRFGAWKDGNENETITTSTGGDTKLAYQGASVIIMKTNQGARPKDSVKIRYYIGDDPNKGWGIDRIRSLVDEAIRLRVIPPKNPTSHYYIGCDELCEMMECSPADLTFNGKNNLLRAVTDDKVFQENMITLVNDRFANADVEYGITEADPEDDAELEMDFEELEEE